MLVNERFSSAAVLQTISPTYRHCTRSFARHPESQRSIEGTPAPLTTQSSHSFSNLLKRSYSSRHQATDDKPSIHAALHAVLPVFIYSYPPARRLRSQPPSKRLRYLFLSHLHPNQTPKHHSLSHKLLTTSPSHHKLKKRSKSS